MTGRSVSYKVKQNSGILLRKKKVIGFLKICCFVAISTLHLVTCEVRHSCPTKILWEDVSSLFCPNNTNYYHCLQIKYEETYEDICKRPIRVTPGKYPVLDSFQKNIDYQQCSPGDYQPTSTISIEEYTCMYQKSQCSEEGQIVYSNGSAIEDRTCTCDYRAGYAFLREPVGKYFCSPSVEDCSCYKKTCTGQSLLNKDYECLDTTKDKQRNNTNTGYNCSVIESKVLYGTVGDEVVSLHYNKHYDNTYYNVNKLNTNNRIPVSIAILILILIYVLILVLLYKWNKYHRTHGTFKIRLSNTRYTENIGSHVTLMVIVSRTDGFAERLFGHADIAEVYWEKNESKLDIQKTTCTLKNAKYTINQFDLKINNLLFEDTAEYRCFVKNPTGLVSSSESIHLKVLGSTGNNFFKNIPPEIQQLGMCGVEQYKKMLKSEVCQQRTIQLVFIGPKDSDKTSLWHDILGIRHEQEDSKRSILNKFSLKLQDGKWNLTDYSGNRFGSLMNIIEDHVDEVTEDCINLIILDIPGGKEYCSVFLPYFSRDCIYILTTDVNTELYVRNKNRMLSNMTMEKEPLYILRDSGEEVRDWLYSIHSLKPASQDVSTHLKLQPSVIYVGTHKKTDTLTKQKDDVLNCVYQKKAVMKKDLIYRCELSTEISSTDDEIKDLQDRIIHTSKHIELWHKEIPRRYFWFEEILLENRDTRVIMSLDEIVQLGKKYGYPVTDKQEFHMFLSYQHEVRNVIFYQDIPEFIIISVEWFFGLINVLIATFFKNSSSKCMKRGQISTDLLNQVIQNSRMDQSNQQENSDIRTVEILQKFNLVCRVKKSNELKQTEMYYVPYLIPTESTADVVTMFEKERRNKTSFLCFSFDFLPASLVHQVMFRLLEEYSVSEDPSSYAGETAIYYRTLVLDYEPVKKQKLYFLSQEHELLFQIWLYGMTSHPLCFERLRKFVEQIVNKFKSRHKMNLNYTYKLKCPDSDHGETDIWDVLSEKPSTQYYCHGHKITHTDLYTVWFTGHQECPEIVQPPIRKHLDFHKSATAMTIPIIKLDGTQYRVPKGQKVTLKCQVYSWKNIAVVTWIRLYKELEIKLTPGKLLKYSGGTSANHSLTIYNVDEEDSGLYWCKAINSSGPSRSDPIQLDIFDETIIKVEKDVLKDNTEKNIEDDISTEDGEERFYSEGEEDDINLLNSSDAKEVASPHINKSYVEEETEQHVSPEARSLTDEGEEDDDSLLDFSDAREVASPYINESDMEEETVQHVSPEARSLTDQEESDDMIMLP